MAVTQVNYTGNGSTTNYSFTFPYLDKTDVKVRIDGTIQPTTAYSFANATTIAMDSAPANGAKVVILRDTNVDSKKGTFYAGSAIKAEDLNNNYDQVLYTVQEIDNNAMTTDGTTPMTGDFVLGEDLSIIFEGATDNANETTLTVADPTADRTITLPNVTGTVVTTGDTGTVTSTMIADATIVNADIANTTITGGKLVNDTITATQIAADAVTASELANNAVDTAAIAADAVTGAKIADDQINSEHYVDGSIDAAHLATDSVTSAKIATNAVTSTELADNAVDTAAIINNAVTTAKITDANVTTAKIADDAITSAKIATGTIVSADIAGSGIAESNIAANAVTSSKIAAAAVTSAELGSNSVTTAKITNANVTADKLANNSVTSDKIITDGVTSAKIIADAVTGAKIADDSIDSEHYVDGSIDTQHLGDSQVTTAKIANASVTNDKIANATITSAKLSTDAVVTNAEQASATVNDTSFFTTSGSDARYFRQDSTETIASGDTWSGGDTKIATTGAIDARIVDLVDDVGGFVPIANETSFPNANPDVNDGAGTLVSIKTLAANHTSNGSGVISISNGTVGNSTVTINGAANSTTYSAGYGMIVETTSTLNTYTFHRLVPKATEVTTVAGISGNITTVANNDANITTVAGNNANITTVAGVSSNVTTVAGSIANVNTTAANIATVNDFADKYRIASSAPGSNNDEGDLYYNTTDNKLYMYNGSAWVQAVTSTGDFALTTGTTFTGNSDHNDSVKARFGTGDDLEIYHDGNKSVVADVGTGGLFIAGSGISLTNAAITETLLYAAPDGDVELYYDNSKKLETYSGGVIVTGTLNIPDGSSSDNRITLGGGGDLKLYHDGTNTYIDNDTGILRVQGDDLRLTAGNNEAYFVGTANGAADLYHNGTKRLETTSGGVAVSTTNDGFSIGQVGHTGGNVRLDLHSATSGVGCLIRFANDHNDDAYIGLAGDTTGDLLITGGEEKIQIKPKGSAAVELYHGTSKKFHTFASGCHVTGNLNLDDSGEIRLGGDTDLKIFHDGTDATIDNDTGALYIKSNASTNLLVNNTENAIVATANGAVKFYYDGSLKAETRSDGFEVKDHLTMGDNDEIRLGNSSDLKIYHNGSDSFVRDQGTGGLYMTGNTVGIHNSAANEAGLLFTENGSVKLYYDGVETFRTAQHGAIVTAGEGNNAELFFYADEGDDNADGWKFVAFESPASTFDLYNLTSGSWEKSINCTGNGQVELYYDNSKKLETFANGIKLYDTDGTMIGEGFDGGFNFTSLVYVDELRLGDSEKIQIGASQDLQLYHDGSNSILHDSGTGSFIIASNGPGIWFQKDVSSSENLAIFRTDGACELNYDSVKKLETTTNGATVTGDLVVTNDFVITMQSGYDFWIDKSGNKVQCGDGISFRCGNAGDLQLYHDGNNSYIDETGTGNLLIKSGTIYLTGTDASNDLASFVEDGAVSLYYDDSKKFNTDSTGCQVFGILRLDDGDGTNGPYISVGNSQDFKIYHNSNHTWLYNSGTGDINIGNNGDNVSIKVGTSAAENAAKFISNGAAELYHNNGKRFATTSNGIEVLGAEGGDAAIFLSADEGDDNADKWRLRVPNGSSGAPVTFTINNYFDGAWEHNLICNSNGTVDLYYDNSLKLQTKSHGVRVLGQLSVGTGTAMTDCALTVCDTDLGGNTPFIGFSRETGSTYEVAIGNQDGEFEVKCGGNSTTHSGLNTNFIIAGQGNAYLKSNHTTVAKVQIKPNISDANGTNYLECRHENNNVIMRIESDGDLDNSNNSYGGLSDVKLKENIVDAGSQWADVKAIKIRNYNFKASTNRSTHTQLGVVAQEVETISPGLVKTVKDIDDVGNDLGTTTKSVKYSVLYLKAVKALQEAMAKIEVLEAKVAALEAG